jgi:threonine/homoserine/homoserine lactone efflux protein
MSIAFLLTTLVVVATPGTGAVYSIAAGLSRGSSADIIAAFGMPVKFSSRIARKQVVIGQSSRAPAQLPQGTQIIGIHPDG